MAAGWTGRRGDSAGLLVGGAVFTVGGGLLWASRGRPLVFDPQSGFFWRGKLPRGRWPEPSLVRDLTPLSEIHALQLLTERVRGDKSSYDSHELNLVLRDGRRLNVVDHGDLDRLRRDAGRLASLLGKPVWDATR